MKTKGTAKYPNVWMSKLSVSSLPAAPCHLLVSREYETEYDGARKKQIVGSGGLMR